MIQKNQKGMRHLESRSIILLFGKYILGGKRGTRIEQREDQLTMKRTNSVIQKEGKMQYEGRRRGEGLCPGVCAASHI